MAESLVKATKQKTIPLVLVSKADLPAWLEKQSAAVRSWVESNSFAARPDSWLMVPGQRGGIAMVLAGVKKPVHVWSIAALSRGLPDGAYHLEGELPQKEAEHACLGWVLGSYTFVKYKKKEKQRSVVLRAPGNVDVRRVQDAAEATFGVRDLINTPPNECNPAFLAECAKRIAEEFGAKCQVISGEALLKHNYPTIHTVGRASAFEPCLADIRWGNPKHPRVTLVGKGVTFDTGGLDIKNSANMELMKKDMGGAAHALALGRWIMQEELPVCLRVLVPAVENTISSTAFRTSDIIKTRKGLTVEVGNTDAEGRLILCDALAEADSEKPELLVDFATLTGAARVALGTDLPAFFTNDGKCAAALMQHAQAEEDPLWQLPLWAGYKTNLKSQVADLHSTGKSGYGGAITAALFLREFVEKAKTWVHIDLMAWNLAARPGRPIGGEAMTLRTLFAYIKGRFG